MVRVVVGVARRPAVNTATFGPLGDELHASGGGHRSVRRGREVVETVSPSHTDGRISFQGTTWPATSDAAEILPGAKVTILYRENLGWRVQPSDD